VGDFADNLARLRVAAVSGTAPPEILRWAVQVIGDARPHAERVEVRDGLLRQAAALVTGTRWARARRLLREVEALSVPPPLRERALDEGVRDLVARAVAVAPAPKSLRQILTILSLSVR
jgi:hypothetical protein